MLTALENGEKGGMWFSLIDKVYRRDEAPTIGKRLVDFFQNHTGE